MSVAFRRDSDEEHLEPKFELPIPAGPNLVTAQGLALIASRIATLETELTSATDEAVIATFKRDLRYWHTRQITAELAPVPAGDRVELGVRVRVLLNGAPRTFELVGDDQADPAAGLISFSAPLARAMIGTEVGDVLPFNGVADGLEILAIDVVGD
jgi:transcription elongation GreA/GreB family factor